MVQLHWEPALQQHSSSLTSNSSSSRVKEMQGFVAAGRVLQQLQQEGLIGSVGVSNFDVPMLMALLDGGVKPASNQVGQQQAAAAAAAAAAARRGARCGSQYQKRRNTSSVLGQAVHVGNCSFCCCCCDWCLAISTQQIQQSCC
jgi:hypothetical protein